DEPLSNLDAKLRIQMRLELKKLHEAMQTTSIYVTHDQIEAMTMGDRIVVMKDGLIQQVGEPLELYFQPVNRFVASFIGSPTMNFIPVHISGSDGNWTVQSEGLSLPVPTGKKLALTSYAGKEVVLGVRPDDLSAADSLEEKGTLQAVVLVVQPVGSHIFLDVTVGGHNLLASVDARTRAKPHQEITLKANLENLHFFDPETELAIGI
ncbi:MAG: TOBE domain-containing protein, partial [Deltaproteobacteria bacterium]|nr:TOBE domain-containing protein [Deltaproteobacteria bacterium]